MVKDGNYMFCTNVEQSERLEQLGISSTTADCHHWYAEGRYYTYHETPTNANCIPAWSLAALIKLMPMSVEIFSTGWVSVGGLNMTKFDVYDNMIDAIALLIKNNAFNMSDKFIVLRELIKKRNVVWNGWEPDWSPFNEQEKFVIHTFNGELRLSATAHRNAILAFPTEKMRDDFYNTNREYCNICKELL